MSTKPELSCQPAIGFCAVHYSWTIHLSFLLCRLYGETVPEHQLDVLIDMAESGTDWAASKMRSDFQLEVEDIFQGLWRVIWYWPSIKNRYCVSNGFSRKSDIYICYLGTFPHFRLLCPLFTNRAARLLPPSTLWDLLTGRWQIHENKTLTSRWGTWPHGAEGESFFPRS